MIVRPWARLASILPDEEVWDDEDFLLVRAGGKSVAFAIAEMLKGAGCEIRGPWDEGDHGWQFTASIDRLDFFGQVTFWGDNEYSFLFDNQSWTDRFFRRQPGIYLALLRGLARALEADSRFSSISWYADGNATAGRERDGPGESSPCEGELPPAGKRYVRSVHWRH